MTMMRSVQRILAVFEVFTSEKNSLTLQEIADGIGLAKSTTFRLVQSLEKAGYLIRLPDQQYCLSFQFTRLAGLVKSTIDIRDIARPVMTALAEETKETVSIHTVSGRNRVCIDSLATASSLRAVVQPGEQVPLLLGSATKTLISHMPKKELAPIVAAIARATKKTQAQVHAELAQVSAQGYAISHGERLLGVSAISAPIRGVNGEVHHCLSIGGPTVRMQIHEKAFVKLAIAAAADISRQFGA